MLIPICQTVWNYIPEDCNLCSEYIAFYSIVRNRFRVFAHRFDFQSEGYPLNSLQENVD